MDILFLLVALLLIGLVGYMAYAKSQRDQQMFSSLYKPVDVHLLDAPTEFDANGSIAFEGNTDFTTQPFEVTAGAYTLHYWFPEAVVVEIELVDEGSHAKQALIRASGEGETPFRVDVGGWYVVIIQPAHDDHWEIEIQRTPPSGG